MDSRQAPPVQPATHGAEQPLAGSDGMQPPPPAEKDAAAAASFWAPDGYRQVVKRLDDAAFYLEQMQRMTAERAALERKFAKDLTKFSAKWEERMGKCSIFAVGDLHDAGMTAAHEAAILAEAHTERSRLLTEDVAKNMAAVRAEQYRRGFGKLVAATAATKAFRKCEGDYGKAYRACIKHKEAYFQKEEQLADLRRKLTTLQSIQSSTTTISHIEKLLAKIKKSEGETAKAKERYSANVDKAAASFKHYTDAMKTQYEATTMDLCRRMEGLKGLLLKHMESLHFDKIQNTANALRETTTHVGAAQPGKDIEFYSEAIGADKTPECILFEAFEPKEPVEPTLLDAEVAKYGAWFSKTGASSRSRSHKRYCVLDGTTLTYFAAQEQGLPTKRKGALDLTTVSEVSTTNDVLVMSTPNRVWKLTESEQGDAHKWAKLVAAAAGVALTPERQPAAPVAALGPDVLPTAESDDEDDDTAAGVSAAHHAAATKIQAKTRGFLGKRKFQKKKKAAVTIQSSYRGYRVRRQAVRHSGNQDDEQSEHVQDHQPTVPHHPPATPHEHVNEADHSTEHATSHDSVSHATEHRRDTAETHPSAAAEETEQQAATDEEEDSSNANNAHNDAESET